MNFRQFTQLSARRRYTSARRQRNASHCFASVLFQDRRWRSAVSNPPSKMIAVVFDDENALQSGQLRTAMTPSLIRSSALLSTPGSRHTAALARTPIGSRSQHAYLLCLCRRASGWRISGSAGDARSLLGRGGLGPHPWRAVGFRTRVRKMCACIIDGPATAAGSKREWRIGVDYLWKISALFTLPPSTHATNTGIHSSSGALKCANCRALRRLLSRRHLCGLRLAV